MVDLDKFICYLLREDGYRSITTEDIFLALKQQGLEYKEGAIKPIKEPVNFEEFPREEQLKWYICIKSIPQKDGGFMPLFCEGEHATIEKIFDMLPELKNDTTLFTEHFRKVTEVDLPKEKPSTIKFDEPDIEEMVEEYKKVLRRETLGVPCNSLYFDASSQIYRQGLIDMYNKVKGNSIELFGMELEIVNVDTYIADCSKCIFYNDQRCKAIFDGEYACADKNGKPNRYFRRKKGD